jgi:hypothetical protein
VPILGADRRLDLSKRHREHALSVREPYGVWGGLSEHEREDVYAQTASAAAS